MPSKKACRNFFKNLGLGLTGLVVYPVAAVVSLPTALWDCFTMGCGQIKKCFGVETGDNSCNTLIEKHWWGKINKLIYCGICLGISCICKLVRKEKEEEVDEDALIDSLKAKLRSLEQDLAVNNEQYQDWEKRDKKWEIKDIKDQIENIYCERLYRIKSEERRIYGEYWLIVKRQIHPQTHKIIYSLLWAPFQTFLVFGFPMIIVSLISKTAGNTLMYGYLSYGIPSVMVLQLLYDIKKEKGYSPIVLWSACDVIKKPIIKILNCCKLNSIVNRYQLDRSLAFGDSLQEMTDSDENMQAFFINKVGFMRIKYLLKEYFPEDIIELIFQYQKGPDAIPSQNQRQNLAQTRDQSQIQDQAQTQALIQPLLQNNDRSLNLDNPGNAELQENRNGEIKREVGNEEDDDEDEDQDIRVDIKQNSDIPPKQFTLIFDSSKFKWNVEKIRRLPPPTNEIEFSIPKAKQSLSLLRT